MKKMLTTNDIRNICEMCQKNNNCCWKPDKPIKVIQCVEFTGIKVIDLK
jgi:hypothetical protein